MTTRRYESSLRIVEKHFTTERSEGVKYFSTREKNFRIFERSWNVPFIT